jgi:hypothetical protein
MIELMSLAGADRNITVGHYLWLFQTETNDSHFETRHPS